MTQPGSQSDAVARDHLVFLELGQYAESEQGVRREALGALSKYCSDAELMVYCALVFGERGLVDQREQSDVRQTVTIVNQRLAPCVGQIRSRLLDYQGHIAQHSADLVGRGKPAPDIFLHVAARLDVSPSRCLVIEDSVNGVLAARRAGMDAIGFLGGGHSPPGYGVHLLEAGATIVVNDFRALQALLP